MKHPNDRAQRYQRLQRDRALDEVITRKQQLARIHMAKKLLRLDDVEYRGLLERVTGLSSSADMTHEQRNQVIAEFARLGFKWERAAGRARAFKGRPKNIDDVPMLKKVEALLADAKRPWAYAHSLAKKMHQVEKVEWCMPHQLHKLVAALQADANRRARPAK